MYYVAYCIGDWDFRGKTMSLEGERERKEIKWKEEMRL
jgi:hypothetical protein